MKLKTWLKKTGKTQARFAASIGASQGQVSHWINGEVLPEFATMVKIQKATKGKVGFKDWLVKETKRKVKCVGPTCPVAKPTAPERRKR